MRNLFAPSLAKQATQGEWVAFISPGKYGTYAVHTPGDNHHGDIVDWPGFDGQKNAENNARYIAAFNPEVVQALLDEREAQSKRIAELEANFTVLAVENASMKLFIRGCCYVFDGEQDEISDAYICATDGGMPQTPATDAFLAEVRAQGVEMFAECAYTLEHHDHAVAFAAELRKGGSQ
ncbi:ead/Ea22-like family protein [Escherichia coli]|nr:ead/Ea22-like family protein [Escherichia coli]